jgi:hypothetical protein
VPWVLASSGTDHPTELLASRHHAQPGRA